MTKIIPLTIGEDTFNLRFGSIGAFLLQQATSLSIQEFSAKVDNETLGFLELHALLYAELESGRRKDRSRPSPWTLDAVGDLIDSDCDGDILEFWKKHAKTVIAAFRTSFHLTMQQQQNLKLRSVSAETEKKDDAADDRPTQAAKSIGDTESNGTIA